jgi:YihY family inner membrane protein
MEGSPAPERPSAARVAPGGGPPAPALWRQALINLRRDRLPLHASALSFATLTSLLPLLALLMALLATPGFRDNRERILERLVSILTPAATLDGAAPAGTEAATKTEQLAQRVQEQLRLKQEELKQDVRRLVEQVAANTGTLSALAFLALLGIAFLTFRNLEGVFNTIWKVPDGRKLLHQLALTTAVLVWGPVFIAASVMVTGAIIEWYAAAAERTALAVFLPALAYGLPVLSTGSGLGALYLIAPNTRVRLAPALAAGMVTAAAWEIGKVAFLAYLSYGAGLQNLYGALGVIPVAFGWIYLSWLILLAGGELCCLLQRQHGGKEPAAKRPGWFGRFLGLGTEARLELPALALAAAVEVALRFRRRAEGMGAGSEELAAALGATEKEAREALARLEAAGVVARTGEEGRGATPRFLPVRDPALIRVDELLPAARGPLAGGRGASWRKAVEVLERSEREGLKSLEGVTLADLAAGAEELARQAEAATLTPADQAHLPQ